MVTQKGLHGCLDKITEAITRLLVLITRQIYITYCSVVINCYENNIERMWLQYRVSK